mmetsp:Transcript_52722/g.162299  ORF Transcript_52722/g.162299 Transcript_52722/m.162299 type:complete len:243 (+) Transcript_52722:608-1336(+)
MDVGRRRGAAARDPLRALHAEARVRLWRRVPLRPRARGGTARRPSPPDRPLFHSVASAAPGSDARRVGCRRPRCDTHAECIHRQPCGKAAAAPREATSRGRRHIAGAYGCRILQRRREARRSVVAGGAGGRAPFVDHSERLAHGRGSGDSRTRPGHQRQQPPALPAQPLRPAGGVGAGDRSRRRRWSRRHATIAHTHPCAFREFQTTARPDPNYSNSVPMLACALTFALTFCASQVDFDSAH